MVQQTITTIWLANTKADPASYAKFGIKGKVFDVIKGLHPQDRGMVVVQGHQAVQLKMDLPAELKYWLPLLSTTTENSTIAHEIRQCLATDDPELWVPALLEACRNESDSLSAQIRKGLRTEVPSLWVPAFLEAELDYNGSGLAASTRRELGTDNLADWVPAFLAARRSCAVTAPA
ncbi:type IV secretion/conjugal transfer ATPase, VirB4 family [compost metagenome]